MYNMVKRLFAILKCVNVDTHLWCISVIAGAVVLCVSFFVEPSQRQLNGFGDDTESVSMQKVIEYSSVLGSLSSIETLEVEEVEEIVDAIPDHSDDEALSTDKISNDETVCDSEVNTCVPIELPSVNEVSVDLNNVYSPDAVEALEKLVQCEASTEDIDGRILVANVVLNRVDSGIWGDDILPVLMAPGQFDPIENGAYKSVDVDSVTKKAVLSALTGEDISQGALYFQKSNARIWGDKKYLFRHGSHSFYK